VNFIFVFFILHNICKIQNKTFCHSGKNQNEPKRQLIDNMFIDIVEADAHNIRCVLICVLCITTLLN
jgi:hypothetical protein